MSETFYRAEIQGERLDAPGRIVSVEPVGQFRKIAWCQTHDSYEPEDLTGCERSHRIAEGGGVEYLDDPQCVVFEIWQLLPEETQ